MVAFSMPVISAAWRFLAKPWVQRVLFAATLAIVAVWLTQLLLVLDISSQELHWRWVAVAALINAIYLGGYAACWHVMTVTTGGGLRFRENVAIWLYSIFGKYLPGRVLGVATRIALSERREREAGVKVAATCVLESAASTGAGLLAATFLSIFVVSDTHSAIGFDPALTAIIGLAAIVAAPFLLKGVWWALHARLGKTALAEQIALDRWAAIVAMYLALWMLWGTILVALVAAVDTSLALDSMWSFVLIYQLAGITGIIAIFTPSGLGVREAVMLTGLTVLVPGPVAALITIGARLINILVEVLAISIGYVLVSRQRNHANRG